MAAITDQDLNALAIDPKEILYRLQKSRILSIMAVSLLFKVWGSELDAKAMLKDVKRVPESIEVDPDDFITDALLRLQQSNREIRHDIDQAGAKGLLARLVKNSLRRHHQKLGAIRAAILEHDADLSEEEGPFESAGDTIRSLRS
ncbi:hypothetical protein [Methylohalobius crimeensis]|uniref:hypothetical protein n=1 Tax=Methylohalobius crimeensis TaxID=244365 RepID=UPI0003B4E8EF|nr:hypothetical protein [Methylohalobius crimeensis]